MYNGIINIFFHISIEIDIEKIWKKIIMESINTR